MPATIPALRRDPSPDRPGLQQSSCQVSLPASGRRPAVVRGCPESRSPDEPVRPAFVLNHRAEPGQWLSPPERSNHPCSGSRPECPSLHPDGSVAGARRGPRGSRGGAGGVDDGHPTDGDQADRQEGRRHDPAYAREMVAARGGRSVLGTGSRRILRSSSSPWSHPCCCWLTLS